MRVRGGYLLLSAAVLGWTALVARGHRWVGDWELHVATVRALMADPWAPRDPLVGGETATPYLSPYPLALALVARAAGARPETVLEWAGLGNVALLLWAFRVLCGRAAALAVTFALLLWGTLPFAWSGFVSLASLSFTQPYPSTFACALMLLCWAALLAYRARGGLVRAALASALAAVIVLVHPFTAAETAVGAAGIVLADRRAWARRLPVLAGTGTAAVALAALWPHTDLTALGGGSDFSAIHRALTEAPLQKYGLILAGLPALLLGRREPLIREMAAVFALGLGIVVAGCAAGRAECARLIPVVALAAQVALARWLYRPRPGRGPYAVLAAGACLLGLYGGAVGLARAVPAAAGLVPAAVREQWPADRPDRRYDFARPHLREGDVVMSRWPRAARRLASWGVRAVAPPYPYPFLPDERRRHAAHRRMFAARTSPAERREIADRYGVRCVLGPSDMKITGFRPVARRGKAVLTCKIAAS